MKNLIYSLIGLTTIACSTAIGQERQLTGTVRGSSGPLKDVTITEKNVTNHQTRTDDNGRFKLNISSGTIVVNHLGYLRQEVDVQGKNTITIQLVPREQEIDEVVVVGYGKTTKKTLTGAVSSISGDEIRQSPSPS